MPKARLLIIGGAEDKGPIRNPPIIKLKNKRYVDYDILGRLINRAEPKKHRIEVVTTASQQPQKTGKMYVRSFKKAGFSNVGHISIENKEELKNEEYTERVKKANVVFFSGGDQYRLTHILTGSEFLETILSRYYNDPDFTLAGTSAGAMAMCEHMIYSAENNETMLKGHVKITQGFGLLKNCIVDTHFAKRGRFGRLFQAVLMNEGSLGLGLGEDSGLMIEDGRIATCVGSGMVAIVDSSNVTYSNKKEMPADYPISVAGLTVHILNRDDRFDLLERKVMPAAVEDLIIPSSPAIPRQAAPEKLEQDNTEE
jgi:cyanophycinase